MQEKVSVLFVTIEGRGGGGGEEEWQNMATANQSENQSINMLCKFLQIATQVQICIADFTFHTSIFSNFSNLFQKPQTCLTNYEHQLVPWMNCRDLIKRFT